jgi:hypothetical protein
MKVDYNFDSLQNCQCGACPVHDGSQCVVQKTQGLKFVECSSDPAPSNVEGIYCSAQKGKSQCGDLPSNKACVCPTCSVWRSHSLDTAYFCTHGSAS